MIPKRLLPIGNQNAYCHEMGFSLDIQRVLAEFVRQRHEGNNSAAATELGVNAVTLWRWLKGERVPRSDILGIAMDSIGAKVVLPVDSDLCFSPTPFHLALTAILSAMLPAHNLTLEKVAAQLWPDSVDATAKLQRILAAKEPLPPEMLMRLCLLMEEDPGKLLRLARERIEDKPDEQRPASRKSA